MPTDLHSRELPRWLKDFIAAVPAQGSGLHGWIAAAAWRLMAWRSDADCSALLITATSGSGRDTRREIQDAVRSARAKYEAGAGWHPGADLPTTTAAPHVTTSPRWPKRDDAMIAGILADGIGQYDLWELSPWRFEHGSEITRNDMLARLFPGDPLLCIGWTESEWRTQPRSAWEKWKWKKDFQPQFIVPSEMSKPEGITKEGKPSSKTNDNTGPRRFLLVEFDFRPDAKADDASLLREGEKHGLSDTLDLCACLLHHLLKFGPLALVVWSGGKSLQGWFPAVGEEEETLRQFFHYACLIGADSATWTPSQFVRLPYGRRNNGASQMPVFFNPEILPPP